eukprot:14507090-Ditylum_brightwellii.AAC.1
MEDRIDNHDDDDDDDNNRNMNDKDSILDDTNEMKTQQNDVKCAAVRKVAVSSSELARLTTLMKDLKDKKQNGDATSNKEDEHAQDGKGSNDSSSAA